jgi:hypothetical protein
MKILKDMLHHAPNAKEPDASQRNSMPLRYKLQIDLFDVWGIDFMGPFKNS